MRNILATDLSHERYVAEVDGIAKGEYSIFVKALKASLQLRQELPKCRIKLRDAGDIGFSFRGFNFEEPTKRFASSTYKIRYEC